MDRREAASIAGYTAWEKSPEIKRMNSAKGGETTLKRYGRSHFRRLNVKRWAKHKARKRKEERANGKGVDS